MCTWEELYFKDKGEEENIMRKCLKRRKVKQSNLPLLLWYKQFLPPLSLPLYKFPGILFSHTHSWFQTHSSMQPFLIIPPLILCSFFPPLQSHALLLHHNHFSYICSTLLTSFHCTFSQLRTLNSYSPVHLIPSFYSCIWGGGNLGSVDRGSGGPRSGYSCFTWMYLEYTRGPACPPSL